MEISINDVKKIAELSRIELRPAEETRFAKTISAIFGFMQVLNEVDTDNVEPTWQVTGLTNVVREDVVVRSNLQDKLAEAFPEKIGKELLVPGVFTD